MYRLQRSEDLSCAMQLEKEWREGYERRRKAKALG